MLLSSGRYIRHIWACYDTLITSTITNAAAATTTTTTVATILRGLRRFRVECEGLLERPPKIVNLKLKWMRNLISMPAAWGANKNPKSLIRKPLNPQGPKTTLQSVTYRRGRKPGWAKPGAVREPSFFLFCVFLVLEFLPVLYSTFYICDWGFIEGFLNRKV